MRSKISPRLLRRKYGALTKSDESTQALLNGVDRQWKKYNDPQFQRKYFDKRFNQIFKQDENSK